MATAPPLRWAAAVRSARSTALPSSAPLQSSKCLSLLLPISPSVSPCLLRLAQRSTQLRRRPLPTVTRRTACSAARQTACSCLFFLFLLSSTSIPIQSLTSSPPHPIAPHSQHNKLPLLPVHGLLCGHPSRCSRGHPGSSTLLPLRAPLSHLHLLSSPSNLSISLFFLLPLFSLLWLERFW